MTTIPVSVKAHVLPSIVKNTEKESEMDTAASNEERDARFILRAKQSVALRAAKSVNDGTTTEKLFYPEDESVKMPPLVSMQWKRIDLLTFLGRYYPTSTWCHHQRKYTNQSRATKQGR